MIYPQTWRDTRGGGAEGEGAGKGGSGGVGTRRWRKFTRRARERKTTGVHVHGNVRRSSSVRS